VGLLHKKRKRKRRRRGMRPQKVAIGCAFCWEWVPEPQTRHDAFSGSGCLGGRCACSAVYVLDETGRDGGQALMDAQALACGGDLDRALELEDGVDYEIKTRELGASGRRTAGRTAYSGYLPPKVWFLKLKR